MRSSPFISNLTDTIATPLMGVFFFMNAVNINSVPVINTSIHGITSVVFNAKSKDWNPMNSTLCSAYDECIIAPDEKNKIGIDAESFELFGDMREATVEEQESINQYVKSISQATGLSFFEI